MLSPNRLDPGQVVSTRLLTPERRPRARAAERQHLCDEALADREALRVELESVRRQTDVMTQELRREISDQRTAYEQRVELLDEAQARSRLTDLRSQLNTRERENSKLATINEGLSVRTDTTQSALPGSTVAS